MLTPMLEDYRPASGTCDAVPLLESQLEGTCLLIVLKKVSHGRSSLAKLATHSQMLQQGVPLRALRLEQVIGHNASTHCQASLDRLLPRLGW
jgi:hypothetical protein